MTIPYNKLLKPRLGSPLDKSHRLARGLVGCWLMNENGGTTALDASGNMNTGTLVADTHWVPGKFGSALNFDGTGDYVNTGDLSSLYTASSIAANGVTYTAWVKFAENNDDDTEHYIVAAGGNFSDATAGGIFIGDGSGWMYAGMRIWDGGAYRTATSIQSDALSQNVWVHIAGTYNPTTGNLEIYVNGILSGTTGITYASNEDPVRSYIGTAPNQVSKVLPGDTDHESIYNRVLSASEIAQLSAEPFQMFKDTAEDAVLSFTPAAGVTVPVMAYHYKQAGGM